MSDVCKECQSIYINGRKKMKIDCVTDVDSFDENLLILESFEGEITVEGSELKVEVLDIEKGVVELKGHIDAVFYSNATQKKKKGIWGRSKN